MIQHDIINASELAGKCQRNWIDEQIDDFDLQTIVNACMNMPTKQNVTMYELMVVQKEENIDFLYEHSTVPEHDKTDNDRWRNAQMLPPTVLLWYGSSKNKNVISEGDFSQGVINYSTTHMDNIKLNAGISMGAAALTATQLGYHTGFNCCFNTNESIIEFGQRTNPDIESFICALGIGKPKDELPRNIVPKNKNLSKPLKVNTEEHRKEKIVYYM